MKNPLKLSRLPRTLLVGAALLAVSLGASASDAGQQAITIYSGQHESIAQALADKFEQDTGIHVNLRTGKDGALANQIIEEGKRSPADVFLTEEPGPIGDLSRRGLLVKVPDSTLKKTDPRFVPSDHGWLPWAARSRVMFYNPKLISEDELPDSILDLTKPKWKGRFAYAPSGAFRSTTAYLINEIGKKKTLAWLKGLRKNGINEHTNGKVRDSVEAGQHAFGISNHYYWYFLARDKGKANVTSRVHYLNNHDAGALMLASGAGVLKSSSHRQAAMKFLDWLVSPQGGQQVVANASPQFPVSDDVKSKYGLPPLSQLTFPEFDQAELNNVDEASDLLKQAGII